MTGWCTSRSTEPTTPLDQSMTAPRLWPLVCAPPPLPCPEAKPGVSSGTRGGLGAPPEGMRGPAPCAMPVEIRWSTSGGVVALCAAGPSACEAPVGRVGPDGGASEAGPGCGGAPGGLVEEGAPSGGWVKPWGGDLPGSAARAAVMALARWWLDFWLAYWCSVNCNAGQGTHECPR